MELFEKRLMFNFALIVFAANIVHGSCDNKNNPGGALITRLWNKIARVESYEPEWRIDSAQNADEWISNENADYAEEPSKQKPTKYSTAEECARTCRVGEPPKTCYYNFTVEYYSSLGKACDLCKGNSPSRLVNDCQCITLDGVERSGMIVVNRMYPGPAIITCLNDYVVVDVTNAVAGNGITVHWHGLFQKGYQYYDGVPHVTQCPIGEGQTFRYQFRTQNAGTHFWHTHTGLQKSEGFEGSFIIRQPKSKEPNGNLWEYDRADHIIFVTDWLHDSASDHFPGTYGGISGQFPVNFLVNGMGQWTDPISGNTTTTPLASFTVKRGHRYRFRLINSFSFACPVTMTIEKHDLKVIASDGEPIKPRVVRSITTFSAERYDFVLHANQRPGTYWIQMRGSGECEERRIQQMALLHYENTPIAATRKIPSYDVSLTQGLLLNKLNVRCNDNNPNATDVVCVSQLESFADPPPQILKRKPDIQIFMPFGFHDYKPEEAYQPGTYRKYLVAGGGPTVALVGNISNNFPPVPMISQRDEIPESQICNTLNKDKVCKGAVPCECTHIEEIEYNSVVEIILVDEAQIDGMSHPFHLHGHSFFIMGEGCADEYNITRIDIEKAKNLDKDGRMKRNWGRPPAKDTFAVPNNGFVIIRFLANNPGYWLFHCHFLMHLSIGMATVFHTGTHEDLPPIPKGFPRCGNFLPPINDDY